MQVRRGLNVPSAHPVLNHTEAWKGFLAKAAERLQGMRPTDVAEE